MHIVKKSFIISSLSTFFIINEENLENQSETSEASRRKFVQKKQKRLSHDEFLAVLGELTPMPEFRMLLLGGQNQTGI